MKNIKYGFSTGALHKQFTVKESLAIFKKLKLSVVELGLVKKERILDQGQLTEITASDLESFSYVSLHAPAIAYGDDQDGSTIIEKIKRLHHERPLDLVVFHPDLINDFTILEQAGFPIGIENMDNRKKSFQEANELTSLLKQHPSFKAVIDINHIFTIDPTMKLIDNFYNQLGDKIVEFHVSGFDGYHAPFVKTKQTKIIEAINNTSTPMINEAVIDQNLLQEELDYFIKNITSKK